MKNKKTNILILDIDETLLNPIPSWIKYVKKNLNILLSESEAEEKGGIQKALIHRGISWKDIEKINKLKINTSLNSNLPLVKDADLAIKKIIKFHDIKFHSYLTARKEIISECTILNLKQYDFPINKIKFVGDSDNPIEDKFKYLEDISKYHNGKIFFIDDNVDLIYLLLNSNEKIIPISALGPFSKYQQFRSKELSIQDRCLPWESIPNFIISHLNRKEKNVFGY